MLFVIVMMLLIVALAAGIGLYVAFPHRGEDVPRASWLARVKRKGCLLYHLTLPTKA
jgi:ABC-type microcin C transport system permease subunit YejB